MLAGVVAAPLAWVLVSMGQGDSARTVNDWAASGSYNTADLIEPAIYLVVAGIVLGLIGTLRFSPLGPLVAGLLLVTPYAGLFADPFAVRDLVPDGWEVLDRAIPLEQPLDNGTLVLLGALLVIATFSAQRWRRWPVAAVSPASPDLESTLTDAPVVDAPAVDAPLVDAPVVGARTSGETPWSAPPSTVGKRVES
ncbi:hypothetical protein Prum_050870 [Phytohabitans rumicis]|uniref:Uncharacterized protein n=1 Tax=Phytohabitans rumicis TaxID=1076125 RepID=A0A6V8LFN7_9ACTN|nr:hypothetical protein Prum_050870 [Phytohabitans rumicis]